ncbi:calcium-binding protein [Cellulomonas sp.]|uniref:calcium-binding protein n=1 Tax=Cellulomonas sp. TaxID=40001 RepID=UPI002812005B|nr:calcium-binding protein [Cellulomonas sp.]
MRHTRLGLTVATVLAATLLLPATAWAGDVHREEFRRPPADPWQVRGFSGDPVATTRGGTITIGEQTLVMLLEYAAPAEWTGSANRLTGWDVEFRMRLGADTTHTCLDEETGAPPPTLLWVGDTTDLVQVGFGPGEICLTYPFQDRVRIPLDTHRWHRYRLEARGQHLRLVVDGRTVLDRDLAGRGAGTVALGFETHQGSSTWDYVRYDTVPGAPPCTIRGTAGPDVLRGTPRDDVICAGAGDDRVSGLGGSDVLVGGEGDDVLLGGAGHDLLQGGWGADVLDSGPDSGRAEGGRGDDRFVTGPDPDGAHQLVGGPGHDVADYGARLGPVTVTLDGVGGDGAPGEGDAVGVPAPWNWPADVEEVRGGHGDDVLTGDLWPDTLVGGLGADLLRGGAGRDALRGADGVPGNDDLDGGADEDTCTADPDDRVVSCNDPSPRPTFPMPTPSGTGSLMPVPPGPAPSWGTSSSGSPLRVAPGR